MLPLGLFDPAADEGTTHSIELWVTDRCWPEFEIADFHQAIRDFAARDRKFGGIADQPARGGA